ncbi:MAG TPA: SIMPL domain-containing protein [Polyangia bacterium]|nr:SIMPL domain-containing protein [Polyangia bacterium]
MSTNGHARVPWAAIAIGAALVASTAVGISGWERVRTRPKGRMIDVTGSAKKRIASDRIEWTSTIATQNLDRTVAAKALAGHVKTALGYLAEQGVKKEEISAEAVTVEEVKETAYIGTGDKRIEKTVFEGYKTSQQITIASNDVPRVARISREITQLLERDVPISSSDPTYYYSKLGELKIEMLAAAAHDARVRANAILAETGGGRVARLRSADMGVINVNPANSTETSWEGNNDTSSLDKDIITIVHVTFELE